MAKGVDRQFEPVPNFQLAEDRSEVVPNGDNADAEFVRDLLVAHSLAN